METLGFQAAVLLFGIVQLFHSEMAAFTLSTEELQSFHTIDRQLFTRIATELGRDRNQAMHVMAFWLWSEEVGFPSVIFSAHNMPGVLLNVAFNEAAAVLNCIENGTPPAETPNTYILMHEQVDLHDVYGNSCIALEGINKIFAKVCLKVFMDSEEQAAVETVQPEEGVMAEQAADETCQTEVDNVDRFPAPLAGSSTGGARVRPSFDFRALKEAIDSCTKINVPMAPLHGSSWGLYTGS